MPARVTTGRVGQVGRGGTFRSWCTRASYRAPGLRIVGKAVRGKEGKPNVCASWVSMMMDGLITRDGTTIYAARPSDNLQLVPSLFIVVGLAVCNWSSQSSEPFLNFVRLYYTVKVCILFAIGEQCDRGSYNIYFRNCSLLGFFQISCPVQNSCAKLVVIFSRVLGGRP